MFCHFRIYQMPAFRLLRCVCFLIVFVGVLVMPFLAFVANTGSVSPADGRSLQFIDSPYIIAEGLGTKRQNAKLTLAAKAAVDCSMSLCPILPQDLGLSGTIPVNLTPPTWEELEALHPEVEPGGRWKPSKCRARSRVAIVVPYMNRDDNLRIFLQHMHPFLQKQQLEYGIFLAEPKWEGVNRTMEFNRGLMRNIAFREATKKGEYDCVIFHDLDLLPEVDYNNYGCPDVPRHMCIAVSYQDYEPFKNGFGGIVALRTDHFATVNGYSNVFFGWGGEDDDLGRRCYQDSGVGIYRIPASIGRYSGAPHEKDSKAKGNRKLFLYGNIRWKTDGLNSLKYTLLEREKRATYTWVFVDYPEQLYEQARGGLLNEIEIIEEEKRRNATKVNKKTLRQSKATRQKQ